MKRRLIFATTLLSSTLALPAAAGPLGNLAGGATGVVGSTLSGGARGIGAGAGGAFGADVQGKIVRPERIARDTVQRTRETAQSTAATVRDTAPSAADAQASASAQALAASAVRSGPLEIEGGVAGSGAAAVTRTGTEDGKSRRADAAVAAGGAASAGPASVSASGSAQAGAEIKR
jgi:hypothetical protein